MNDAAIVLSDNAITLIVLVSVGAGWLLGQIFRIKEPK